MGSDVSLMSKPLPIALYRDAEGNPLEGFTPAPRARRAGAWAVDVVLLVCTLGLVVPVSASRFWQHGTTPGKKIFRLQVFGTDTRAPAGRGRMVRRSLLHRTTARLIGLSTLGLGWVYVIGGAAGTTRRTLYDDWAQTVVLARPRKAVA